MSDKQMTLELRILARGQEAIGWLNRVTKSVSDLGSVAGKTFGFVGSAFERILAPLKWAAGGAMALGGAFASLGGMALKAAADDEKLISRLTALYGSADKARSKFEDLEAVSRHSPFNNEALVQANMVLEQYGLGGAKNLRTVATAARMAGVDLGTLSVQVGAMQARGLKVFGIELDEKDGKTTFTFRDRMQQVQKVVGKGADDARRQLIKIFDLKFGSGGPATLSGAFAAMRHTIDQAFAAIGTPMLDVTTRFVSRIRDRIEDLIKSGKLEEFGTKIAQKLQDAWDYGASVLEVARGIFDKLNAGNSMAVIKELMAGAGEILAVTFVNYLRAMGDVFTAIGHLIGAGLIESVPFFRKEAAMNEATRAAESGNLSALQSVDPNYRRRIAEIMDRDNVPQALAIRTWAAGLSDEQQGKLARQSSQREFAAALNTLTNDLPRLGAETMGAVGEIARQRGANIAALVGYNGPGVGELVQQRRDARAADAAGSSDLVSASFYKSMFIPTRTGGYRRDVEVDPDLQMSTAPGTYKAGGRYGYGGGSIVIHSVTVKANSVERLQEEIRQAAGGRNEPARTL